MFFKCRVSVIKRQLNTEICNEYLRNQEHMKLCNKMVEGDVYEILNPFEMPEGICPSAWADIRPYILTIASGGAFPFMSNKHSIVTSCSDLFRPVLFYIERV